MAHLNILIVSTQTFCERLKLAVRAPVDEIYRGNVIVKVANSAEYLRPKQVDSSFKSVENIEKNAVDYVFVVLDGRKLKNQVKYHEVLENLMPHYTASRVVLVNGTCRSAPNAGVVAEEMIALADEYGIPYVNAEIMDDESCRKTAVKLLRLAAVSSGQEFGTPIPIPNMVDLGLQPPSSNFMEFD